jgi:hypothetical protein
MRLILLLVITCSFSLFAQNALINEIMSSNYSTIADEDGDYNDWIEIFNNQDLPLNLAGYGISDDSTNLFKWIMPEIILQPDNHLLLFASGKNRSIVHWETIINWGDTWKYRPGTSEPPAQWKDSIFNDDSWLSGKSGFGYGDNDDSTIISAVQSLYIRKTFLIDNIDNVEALILHVDYDDAFVAYLNGFEIARANIGTAGIPPAYNQSAVNAIEAQIYQGGKPETFIVKDFRSVIRQGTNVLAIQVHNYGTASSDMTMIPFLTAGLKQIPAYPRGTHPILNLSGRNLHTNFKLSSEGEKIILTNPQGTITDGIIVPPLPTDISYGRQPDGSSTWFYFSQTTPGESNITPGMDGFAGEPRFSLDGGLYPNPVNVTIAPSSDGNVIRYTLDGSDPIENSAIYSTPISINSSKVLKAREFNTDMLPGNMVTNTYLINFSTNLPVISVSTNPGNFFDIDYGIYVLGRNAESASPNYGANFWEDWERPVHIELFDNDGGKFKTDAGVKIYGGWTRSFAQKSLAVHMRQVYGSNTLNYKLFPDLPYTEYKSFVLRNSGNDWEYTLLRDALTASLVTSTGLDKQAYRPVIVFLNGQYWGIHDLREKLNESFLSAHYNVNKDSIDLLQDLGLVLSGSNNDYMALYNFISSNNMSVQANYEYVKSQIDINNFINYYVSQIYCANRDWPGNNLKYWKKSGSGKWRWILFDTDFGFGLYNSQGYTHNTLDFATATNGPDWPNPPWSTLMLRRLLLNVSFKNDFINRFADFSNTIFKAQNVTERISQLKSAIEPEIQRHSARWGKFNLSSWSSNIQVLNNFANQRLSYARSHFLGKFSLPGVKNVNLFINDTAKGSIKLNSLTITSPSWSGFYFINIPISITAEPKRGYKFVKWLGSLNTTDISLNINLADVLTLTAEFEVDEYFSEPQIVINEINYNSSPSFNPEDWIEFYNNSDSSVNMSGWVFMDEDTTHIYTFPAGTIINGRQFIVLCRDTALFKSLFSYPETVYGDMGFGLSGGGELVRLYDNTMYLIDSLTYGDRAPWPPEPDGNGPTLSLKNPDLDNSDPANWGASLGYGTPGAVNDNLTDVNDPGIQDLPAEFSLYQNYPNPFNPMTTINYEISEAGHVDLRIYSIIGEEVAVLINEEKYPGRYSINFNASTLASAVYFYKLQSGGKTLVKRMILLK